jgi:hypothetical protein
MEVVPRERPDPGQKTPTTFAMCAALTSERTICDDCSERLGIEALSRKKHEEQGDAWSPWE